MHAPGTSRSPEEYESKPGDKGSWEDIVYGHTPSVTNLRVSPFKRHCSSACCLNVCLLLALLCTIGTILYLILAQKLAHREDFGVTEVSVFCGRLKGFVKDGIIHFLGVPYALAPINERRFRRPVELNTPERCSLAWVRNQSQEMNKSQEFIHYKSPCTQLVPITNEIVGEEDCLYLNIFVPSNNGKEKMTLKPVIIIINGLLFIYGASNGVPTSEGQQPHAEAVHRVDAIHVTFNYRTGPIGFLVNPSTKEPNLGLYDQLAAVRWVRSNIQAFGGDPTKITLFGYGSGATCALALLYSSLGQNLFDRVWISSPALQRPELTIDKAVEQSSLLYACDSQPNCRNAMLTEIEDILRIWDWNFVQKLLKEDLFDIPSSGKLGNASRTEYVKQPMLIHDGELVNLNKWSQVPYHIPIVLGQTAHETALYMVPSTLPFWTEHNMKEYFKHKLVGYSVTEADITEQYRASAFFASSCSPESAAFFTDIEAHLTGMTTDARCTCPMSEFVKQTENYKGSTYRYYLRSNHRRFDPYSLKSFVSLAFHGWDGILYLRGYHSHQDFLGSTQLHSDDLTQLNQLSDILNDAMYTFSRTGRIEGWVSVEQPNHVNVIEHGTVCQVEQFLETRCKLWSQVTQGDLMRFAWHV